MRMSQSGLLLKLSIPIKPPYQVRDMASPRFTRKCLMDVREEEQVRVKPKPLADYASALRLCSICVALAFCVEALVHLRHLVTSRS